VADSIRSCSGYFFTGGSQSRVMDVFRPGDGTTPAYDALMDRWREGAVVAGTSAGAAMMSTVSIAGGSSQSALESGIGATEDDDGLWIRQGMEFVPWALVDQHFLARGRWARLVVATLAHPDPGVGVGIDENTALVVDGGVGEVAGASGVIWLDTRGSRGAADQGGRFTLLGRGDRVHILDGRVERTGTPLQAGASVGMATPGANPADSDAATSGAQLLERWALLHALSRMTAESAPLEVEMGGWALTLSPAPGFERLGDGGPGVEGAPGGLSVGPLELVARRSADSENP
jgi:cyanophycinase